MEAQQKHRPGLFKQPAKRHKTGRHRTKSQINRDTKGKAIFKKQLGPGSKLVKRISRVDRLSLRKQVRELKRLARQKRLQHEGGNNRAPHLVTVLSLDSELLSTEVMERLLKADDEATISRSERGSVTYMNLPRFKARYGFICPNPAHLDALLDCLKISDVLMILWPTDGEISDEQKTLLDIILTHGATTPMHLVAGLPPSGKQREQLRKAVTKTIESWMPTKSGIFFCDSNSDVLQILRHLPTIRKRPTINQSRRPHMLVENAEMTDVDNGMGTLKLTGYVRGAPFNVNKLVYIQGYGHFQMQKIVSLKDPRSLREQKHKMETGEVVLAIADAEKQESLQSEVIPDPMDADQPEPSENGDDHLFKVPKIKKKVPKGTSDYQAEWILDDEEGDDGMEDDEYEDDEMEEVESDADDEEQVHANERIQMDMEPVDDQASVVGGGEMSAAPTINDTVSMAGIEDVIDEVEVQKYREQVEELQWPDHVDAPIDQPARERFQRYRALKSFRTSPWDPKENLPLDYARIFKFANFSRTKKLAIEEVDADYSEEKSGEVALPGSYVTLFVTQVPAQILDNWPKNLPFTVHGMLRNEQRFSLMNVVLRKYSQCKVPIKNKQTLIFHVGYRRFEVDPVFSQHSNGTKFKMERFMPEHGPFVASYYGPVTYGPCPVLVFRRDEHGQQQLAAYGSVADANPDRIVLKRIVLGGEPYKVTKRAAIVRFMFFNKEDIEWFKPVELYTDSGNRGHIKDSVGTHGIMKCVFNLPLKKQEQVKMNLYKRVFPRWTYNPHIAPTSTNGGPPPMLELPQKSGADVEMAE